MSLFSGPPPGESDSSYGPSDVSITDVSSGSDLEDELDTLYPDSGARGEINTLEERTKQSTAGSKSLSSSKSKSKGRSSKFDSDDEVPSDSDDEPPPSDNDEPPSDSDNDMPISDSEDNDNDIPSDDDDDSIPPSSGEEESDDDNVAELEHELADMKLPAQRVRSTGKGDMKVVLPSNVNLEDGLGGLSGLTLGKKGDRDGPKGKLNGNKMRMLSGLKGEQYRKKL